ncbi:inorganic phosphate transporter Pho88 [Parasitella parasitica]|nr:inorganic phosphate transporter Pho88 [Parasitella parasitica]
MEYDIADVKKQLKQGFTSIAIVAFLHLKFGYVQPLLIQSIMGFKTFFITKEARIHFFNGTTSRGELRRPFRIEAPFNMVNEKRQPKTDKGSIKRAEKALKAQ